jgi:hypothetical protein
VFDDCSAGSFLVEQPPAEQPPSELSITDRDRQRFRSTKPFAPSADTFVRTLGERDPELRDAQVITRPGHE